jgi:hypothetical protein
MINQTYGLTQQQSDGISQHVRPSARTGANLILYEAAAEMSDRLCSETKTSHEDRDTIIEFVLTAHSGLSPDMRSEFMALA